MGRKKLVVKVRPDRVVLWRGKLPPHGGRKKTGKNKKAEAGDEITFADGLVVGDAERADDPARHRQGSLETPCLRWIRCADVGRWVARGLPIRYCRARRCAP